MDPLFDFSLEFTRWFQGTYPQLEGFFKIISQLGREEFYLVLVPLIYWCLDKRLGRNVMFIFLFSAAANFLFKHSFRGPRPYWLDDTVKLTMDEDYGIPSAHAQLASTLYLYIAYWIKRGWVWVLALLMVIAMGLSRIYLGAHFVHDVLAGILISLMILIGYVFWYRNFSEGFKKRILGQKLLAAFLVAAIFAAVYTIVRFIIGEPDFSVEWSAFIPRAEALGIEEMATAVGSLFGIGIGINLESSRTRFKIDGPVWKRVLRYLLGMVITVAIWAGLDAVFPADPMWLGIPLRILRYFLTMLFVGYYGPDLFVRVKLAETEPDPGIELKL